MRENEGSRPFESVSKMLVLIAQLGILMIVPIVGCTLVGAWLGEILHILWMGVPGFVIGAVAGAQACFRMIRRMTADWPTDDSAGRRKGEHSHEGLEENE